MPYASDKQRRWAHTKTGMKKLGASKVSEFDAASKGMNLPEKSAKSVKKKLKKAR